MEKHMTLETPDGHTIYGVLNAGAEKSQSVIVFVHGLGGHKNEHQFFNAVPFFLGNDIDTFRFDLYNGQKGGRKLSECTVHIHAQDLEVVLKHFQGTYEKIHVVGHSLGGPTIVSADLSHVRSIVLWDPTAMETLEDLTEGQERAVQWNESLNVYIIDWGVELLLGKGMSEEYETLEPAKLAKNIRQPIKIIAAEMGNEVSSRKYFEYANDPKELVVLKGAGHTFDEEGAERKLFEETLGWIERH